MTFLNGILLAGAAAFMIPLMIHLLNRRRQSIVKWGAMHLLQEVLRQKKRRIQIEQWLLLVVRIALPIILALCLARPVMTFFRSLPGFGQTSLVVLLDDSFSMRASGTGGSPQEQARLAIQRMADNLPRGSDVQVIQTSGTPRSMLDGSTSQLDLVPKALAEVLSLGGPVNANDAFQSAAAALNKAANGAREIVVMSDFQSSDWKPFADGAAVPALETILKQEPKPALTFFQLNNDLTENLSVASLELSALVAAEGQPVGVRVRIKNHGKRLWQDVALNLEADGARLRTTRITVPGDGEVTTSFTHAFDKVGDHALGVRLEGDALTEDNAAQAVLRVRRQIDVLLIDGNPSTQPLSGSVDFLEIALSPHMAAATKMKDLVITTKVDAKRLRNDDFKGKEVVIMANVGRPQRLQDLEKFVKEGGGLMVFAGPECDVRAYQNEFFRNGQGLFPASVKGFGHTNEGENPARILLQRFTHPATTYFNDARGGRLQDAEIKHWLQLEPKNDEVKTLFTLDRGAPLFIEKTVGRGRVIACATSANPEWTNMPLQMVFVPLVQRLVSYLGTPDSAAASLVVGSSVQLGLQEGRGDEVYELTDPAGKQTEVKARKESNGVVLSTPPTREPGLYDLRPKGASDDSARKFAINVSPAESDLKPLTAGEVEKLATRYEAGYADNYDGYQRLDRTRRHGSELWQFALLILLVLLFVEVLLEQRISKA